MASTIHVVAGALVGLLYWSCLGFLIMRRVAPELAAGMAPVVGWATHNAIAMPVFLALRFSPAAVAIVAATMLICAFSVLRPSSRPVDSPPPLWLYVPAGLLALAPAAAILPKMDTDGVFLAAQIFDHAKVAIIDDIVRFGVPAGNPFLADPETPHLIYYYLWHFSAAQIAAITGITGWEADAGLTWFSAAAAVAAMTAFVACEAGWLSALMVAALSATASAGMPLQWIFGEDNLDSLLSWAGGLRGLLFQSAWVPQHLLSAACVFAAVVVMSRLAFESSAAAVLTLAFLAAAAFGSSTWIGGVVFAIAAPAIAVVLMVSMHWRTRAIFMGALALSAILAVALAAPFWSDQLGFAALRGAGSPISVQFYPVLEDWVPERVRAALDPLAFWFIFLPIELPAVYLPGMVALVQFAMSRKREGQGRPPTRAALATLAITSLAVSWLLPSTLADNNDLGWRAILPGVMALTVFSALGIVRWMTTRRIGLAMAVIVFALGVPGAVDLIRANLIGGPAAGERQFAAEPELWDVVRRYTVGDERVANNPLSLADLTPWPVNISWALLARRRSCYAGRELALVYATLTEPQRDQIDDLFVRVFAGDGSDADIRDLATRYACAVVVLTAGDGAWTRDPFSAAPFYRLVEERAGRWRIYHVTAP